MKAQTIGFIGQGWIGKNYADNFEDRGCEVIRYGKEELYSKNKERIRECELVFIAVPAPTTPKGYDASIIRETLSLIGKGHTAVIKSTLPLGLTAKLQKEFPDIYLVHSPEFLSVSTAREDADFPERNIVGIPEDTPIYRDIAQKVFDVLPEAPYSLLCSSEEAEMIKYAHNISGYFQVILFNLLYDVAATHECQWDTLKEAFTKDSMMSHRYLSPVDKGGRGAGGECLIKDFATFISLYKAALPKDTKGLEVLTALEAKNKNLLKSSGKDIDILRGVYGD